MRISSILWLEDIVEKIIRKHNVQPTEVREVLDSSGHFRFIERGHRPRENVYASLGRSRAGRYLIVFFVYKNDKQALILSARDMTKAERRLYEKK